MEILACRANQMAENKEEIEKTWPNWQREFHDLLQKVRKITQKFPYVRKRSDSEKSEFYKIDREIFELMANLFDRKCQLGDFDKIYLTLAKSCVEFDNKRSAFLGFFNEILELYTAISEINSSITAN